MYPSAFRRLTFLWLLCIPFLGLFSCSKEVYNQRVMFRLDDAVKGVDTTTLRRVVNRVNRNYTIQPNDFLAVRVYTNNGERIIDPNGELQFGSPPGGASLPNAGNRNAGTGQSSAAAGTGQGAGQTANFSEFLVQTDGYVTLPLINRVKLSGYTLLQADSVLQVRYSEFYKGVFVTTRVTNNRVIVLGSPGGRIVPLTNDNMNLLEVLAAAGGIDGASGGTGNLYRSGGKVSNIRIIRGDLKNPQIEQVDLTTINGMRRANLQMEPNDIVYIEPIRRPFYDGLADSAPIFTAASLLVTTFTVLYTIFRN